MLPKFGSVMIAVACHEWRNGIMINTVRKEYSINTCTRPPPPVEYKTALFPNPCQNYVELQTSVIDTGTMVVYDLFGAQLLKRNITGRYWKIDTSHYPRGIYILAVRTRHFNERMRLLKY